MARIFVEEEAGVGGGFIEIQVVYEVTEPAQRLWCHYGALCAGMDRE